MRARQCYWRNGKRSSGTGLVFWTTGEKGEYGKAGHRVDRATLGAGLVSVSGVLVLGVLSVDYRVNVTKLNRKRVNPGNSGAGFQRFVHHEVGKWRSKRRKRKPV